MNTGSVFNCNTIMGIIYTNAINNCHCNTNYMMSTKTVSIDFKITNSVTINNRMSINCNTNNRMSINCNTNNKMTVNNNNNQELLRYASLPSFPLNSSCKASLTPLVL